MVLQRDVRLVEIFLIRGEVLRSLVVAVLRARFRMIFVLPVASLRPLRVRLVLVLLVALLLV